ncbi:MAG: hypothetical protein ABH807_00860 [Candidatus Shapirobacteria bacterium]
MATERLFQHFTRHREKSLRADLRELSRDSRPNNFVDIPELNLRAVVGKEDNLRVKAGIRGWDLLSAAQENGIKLSSLIDILAIQMSISQSPEAFKGNRFQDGVYYWPYMLPAIRTLVGNEYLPFFVGQTIKAIIDFGVDICVNPRLFQLHHTTYGNSEPGMTPTLIGSFFYQVFEEGVKKGVFMRYGAMVEGETTWNIAGGHYDNVTEVAGLEEAREEMGLTKSMLRCAFPLCIADQVFSPQKGKTVRYLSMIWSVNHDLKSIGSLESSGIWPKNEVGKSEWVVLTTDEIINLAREGKLAPVALCALVASGHLNPNDYPEIKKRSIRV